MYIIITCFLDLFSILKKVYFKKFRLTFVDVSLGSEFDKNSVTCYKLLFLYILAAEKQKMAVGRAEVWKSKP